MENRKEILAVLNTIDTFISKHGIKPLINYLEKGQELAQGNSKKEFDFIILTTCEFYKVEKDDVLFTTKRGDVSAARKMCFCLIRMHMNIDANSIANLFGKSRQIVSREIRKFKDNKENHSNRREIKFYEDYTTITATIVSFKNQLTDD